jgi:hypothetical protein
LTLDDVPTGYDVLDDSIDSRKPRSKHVRIGDGVLGGLRV